MSNNLKLSFLVIDRVGACGIEILLFLSWHPSTTCMFAETPQFPFKQHLQNLKNHFQMLLQLTTPHCQNFPRSLMLQDCWHSAKFWLLLKSGFICSNSNVPSPGMSLSSRMFSKSICFTPHLFVRFYLKSTTEQTLMCPNAPCIIQLILIFTNISITQLRVFCYIGGNISWEVIDNLQLQVSCYLYSYFML